MQTLSLLLSFNTFIYITFTVSLVLLIMGGVGLFIPEFLKTNTILSVLLASFLFLMHKQVLGKILTRQNLSKRLPWIFIGVLSLLYLSNTLTSAVELSLFKTVISLSTIQTLLTFLLIYFGYLLFTTDIKTINKKRGDEAQKVLNQNLTTNSSLYESLRNSLLGNHKFWLLISVILVIVTFGITRLYSLDVLDGSDLYDDLAIKNLAENGTAFYSYSAITEYFSLLLVKFFGFSIPILKVPYIFYSFTTLIILYFIGSYFGKAVAVVSIALFALSPWSIIVSKMTRDYSYDAMVTSGLLLLSFYIYKRWGASLTSLHLFSWIFFISILFYYLNRPQTILALGIPFLFVIFFMLPEMLEKKRIQIRIKDFNLLVRKIYFPILFVLLTVGLFYLNKLPFLTGFRFDPFYFNVFFRSDTLSPWHWFWDSNLQPIIILTLVALPILSLRKCINPLQAKMTFFISVVFFFFIGLYVFKFYSHVDYNPVRYIYFLFPIYCLLIANGLYLVFKSLQSFKPRVVFFSFVILLFFNPTPLLYSINPSSAYLSEGITNIQADNLGHGKFDLNDVVTYLRNNLKDEDALVVDGNYSHYILLMNLPMSSENYLKRNVEIPGLIGVYKYDTSSRIFVESTFFGYHELSQALKHTTGYFVTKDKFLVLDPTINNKVLLNKSDFEINNRKVIYITEINGTKVYYWNYKEL